MGERERRREAAAAVPRSESHGVAIVIAVTCAMHGEKYRRAIKVPSSMPAESFLHGGGLVKLEAVDETRKGQ